MLITILVFSLMQHSYPWTFPGSFLNTYGNFFRMLLIYVCSWCGLNLTFSCVIGSLVNLVCMVFKRIGLTSFLLVNENSVTSFSIFIVNVLF